jgi:hypothetical protein
MKTLSGIFLLCAAAVISPAQSTVSYYLSGTLTKPLSGDDCLKLANMMISGSVSISSMAVPMKTTSTSATYVLPAGSVMATVGPYTFTNTANWLLTYTLTSTSDKLTLSGPGPSGITSLKVNAHLPTGSFPSSVLGMGGHPAPLVKSPITLKSPKSYLLYTTTLCTVESSSTKMGVNGSISNKPADSPR